MPSREGIHWPKSRARLFMFDAFYKILAHHSHCASPMKYHSTISYSFFLLWCFCRLCMAPMFASTTHRRIKHKLFMFLKVVHLLWSTIQKFHIRFFPYVFSGCASSMKYHSNISYSVSFSRLCVARTCTSTTLRRTRWSEDWSTWLRRRSSTARTSRPCWRYMYVTTLLLLIHSQCSHGNRGVFALIVSFFFLDR